jgi:hypothetical protein
VSPTALTPLQLLGSSVMALLLALAAQASAVGRPLGTGFCADALGGGRADQSWTATLRSLHQGRRPATIPEFPCFAGRPANLAELSPQQGYRLLIQQGFSRAVLRDALARGFNAVIRNDQQLGLKRYQNLAWGGVYLSEAALLAYQRTGDEQFLELFEAYFDRVLERRDVVLGRRDDFRGAVRQGWGSSKVDANRWINLVTHNGRIVYPATQFALLVQQTPALQRFRAKANHYTAVSVAVLDEFDPEWQLLNPTTGDSWFPRPPRGEPEASNRIHLVGRSWLNLAKLTGDSKYKQRVEALITTFLKGVRDQPDDTLSWSYYPSLTLDKTSPSFIEQEPGEPVWKATLTVPFLLEAYQQGYPVPQELIRRIATTWNSAILSTSCMRYRFDATDNRCLLPDQDRDKIGMLQTVMGILPYSAIEPRLADTLQNLVASRADLFPGGWLGSAAGMIGYAYFLQPDH